jgi:PAS domain S-box-containing protein
MPTNNESKIDMNEILIVDDQIPNLQLLSELLDRDGYQTRAAKNPQMAIDSALAQPPRLILLDVKMPEMDGFEVCRRLKQDERTRDIPIIFISALQDVQDKVRGFEAGGVDFISKPFQEREVLARVRTHMELRNMQLNLEEIISKRTAELSESEKRFRATFEQAAVGIAHVSPEGRFLRVNQKWCDIVGYSHEEMTKLTFQAITHPDDLDADLDSVRQMLNGEIETYFMEKRYFHKSGEVVWINLTVSLVRNEAGQPQWFVSVIEDISDRKQAEEDKALLFHDLGERLKELECMYTISNSVQTRDSLDETFQDTVDAIPPGWHYPEITRGKLRYNEKEWVSEPFEETEWKQTADITVKGKVFGSVEVYYLEECQILDEGPFMKEERQLIDSIARTLSEAIERKTAETALREREATLSTLLNAPLDIIMLVSREGAVLNINEGGANGFGKSPEEMIGHNIFQSMPGEVAQLRKNYGEKVFKTGKSIHFEDEREDKHFASSIYPVFDAAGENVTSLAVFSSDISKLKRAEQALEEQLILAQLILRSSPVGIASIGLDGKIQSANPALCEMLGRSTEELTQLMLADITCPEDIEYCASILKSLVTGEVETCEFEKRYIRKDGQPFLAVTRAGTVRNPDGLPIFISGTIEDITERKRIADDLIKSEEKYRDLVDNSMVGVFTTTLDGRFLFVNDAMARMYDFDSTEQMLAEGALVRWKDPKQREQMLTKLKQHGSITNYEVKTITHTDEQIYVIFSAKLQAGTISGMVMDITKRKLTEEEIQRYQERLKHLASQLTIAEENERSRISADLHDHIGQTLAFSRIQIAKAKKYATEEKLMTMLDEISQSLLAAIQDTKELVFDLSSPLLNEIGLCAAIQNWLINQVGKEHGIKTEFICSEQELSLSKDLKFILFRNVRELITNVIKHSQATEVSVTLERDESELKITVLDDGVGFVFDQEKSYTCVSPKFGLFSIKERMEDFGGTLEVISKPGKGCRVVMTVPV